MAIEINGTGTITGISVGGLNDGCVAAADLAEGAALNSISHGANFRNRIINGDMRIDQRNAGASVTLTSAGVYTVDRFIGFEDTDGVMTAQQDSSAPPGFNNSLKLTTTTADGTIGATQYAVVQQRIEGFNVADLGWGTANAKTVTLSFWVRSSLTGTFGGSFTNSAFSRGYPFTYTISSADTWEQKSVTVSGDTTGTWLTNNGLGLRVTFGLGVGSTYSVTAGAWSGSLLLSATGATSVIGTLNATWYITGVQLEVGSVATPFERRPYGTELALCQRYYFKTDVGGGRYATGYAASTTTAYVIVPFVCQMRTAPSALEQSGTASNYAINYTNSGTNCSAVPTFTSATVYSATSVFTIGAAALTAGWGIAGTFNANGYLAWSAEL